MNMGDLIFCFIASGFIFVVIAVFLVEILFRRRKRRQYDFYLAGPMRSYPNGNKEMFLKAAAWLRKQGFSVWNPAEQNDGNKNFHSCIAKDLNAIINQCRGIVLLPGWRNSLGANAEALTAYVCGKPAQFLSITTISKYIYLQDLDLEKTLTLPFSNDTKEFRSKIEMLMPENEVFNTTR